MIPSVPRQYLRISYSPMPTTALYCFLFISSHFALRFVSPHSPVFLCSSPGSPFSSFLQAYTFSSHILSPPFPFISYPHYSSSQYLLLSLFHITFFSCQPTPTPWDLVVILLSISTLICTIFLRFCPPPSLSLYPYPVPRSSKLFPSSTSLRSLTQFHATAKCIPNTTNYTV